MMIWVGFTDSFFIYINFFFLFFLSCLVVFSLVLYTYGFYVAVFSLFSFFAFYAMIYPISTLLLSNVHITTFSMHELTSDSLKLRVKVLTNRVSRSKIVSTCLPRKDMARIKTTFIKLGSFRTSTTYTVFEQEP